jgi:hypothetical protein
MGNSGKDGVRLRIIELFMPKDPYGAGRSNFDLGNKLSPPDRTIIVPRLTLKSVRMLNFLPNLPFAPIQFVFRIIKTRSSLTTPRIASPCHASKPL